MRYALIKDGIVVNTIVAEQPFIDTIKDQYDAVIENDSAAIGWTYDGSVLAPPVIVISLPDAMAQQLQAFSDEVFAYTSAKYPTGLQVSLLAMLILAQLQGRNNQINYLLQVFQWAESVLQYNIKVVSDIQSLRDSASVLAYTWNLDANIISDPGVTLFAAAQILT